MKQLLVVSMFVLVGVAFGEDVSQNSGDALGGQGEIRKNDVMRKTGGRIVKPGSQQGEVVYVNCQSAADRSWIESSIDYFRKETRFKIVLKEGTFDLKNPQIQGSASLFIVDEPALPALLCAPEDRWAVVNVAKLQSPKLAFFEARVKKELTRGFAFLCGAVNSSYQNALTGGITKASDLDRHIDNRLPVDVLARFAPYMVPFGVTPAKVTTYRSACIHGWAPSPTNDYQRAVWEELHAPPTEPIKILPESRVHQK